MPEFFTFAEKSVDDILHFLEPNPNLPPALLNISEHCAETARIILDTVPRSLERTAGFRKLLEAKDCFVRAALPR